MAKGVVSIPFEHHTSKPLETTNEHLPDPISAGVAIRRGLEHENGAQRRRIKNQTLVTWELIFFGKVLGATISKEGSIGTDHLQVLERSQCVPEEPVLH